MEKRYQVFISSTFTDLKDERQAVLRGILELNHMPAGMELFPATDNTAWELIEDIIDSSDYYILIIGGRYGSLDETGLGFTEKEYDYAVSLKKPVIALFHENPEELPRAKTETDTVAWDKLQKFRAKVERKHTRVSWRNSDELKARVIIGLTAAAKRHPVVGWVRADNVANESTLVEMIALKTRVSELEKELSAIEDRPPPGAEELSQGDDEYDFHVGFSTRKGENSISDMSYTATISPTWNMIFAAVGPSMIHEAADRTLKATFQTFLIAEIRRTFEKEERFKNTNFGQFVIQQTEVETSIIQLRALGLIKPNDKKRSVHDKGSYWTLTPYGNTSLVQLRAIRKDSRVIEISGKAQPS